MEKGYYSVADLKAMIFKNTGIYYYVGYDSYGNYIEIEFKLETKTKDLWIVEVRRFYTSYLEKITALDDPYMYHIPKEDFGKIRRKSRFF